MAWSVVFVLVPAVSMAQVPPPGGGQGRRADLERTLQLNFQRSVQSQLQLDQAQVQSLRGVTQTFQAERSALSRAQASLRYRLRDPALRDMDETAARALLTEMVTLQQQELDLYKREQEELLKFLTPVQVVRYYRLRDDLGQRVQQLRLRRGGGGFGGGVSLGAQGGNGNGNGGGFFR
jgi:Spy/CpxP family protein refolding chaperone